MRPTVEANKPLQCVLYMRVWHAAEVENVSGVRVLRLEYSTNLGAHLGDNGHRGATDVTSTHATNLEIPFFRHD